jgi:phosphatidate cytidylyltransferase
VRERSISAIGVVIVGVLPALLGGPVFAITLTALCLIGLREYERMAKKIGGRAVVSSAISVALFGAIALLGTDDAGLMAAIAFASFVPLIILIFFGEIEGAFASWALAAAGSLYLGLPLFAAIALRGTGGAVSAQWLTDLTGRLSFGWDADPRGLAWLLTVILVTWLSDTGAYLTGRSFGKRPLIPRISPKKTVEGLAGGLVASSLTGAICVALFGLDFGWGWGLLFGLAIGAVGVVGDLAESLMKRQAGVKDSGTLIPGHGGMLDRLDALLFTWVAGWLAATLIDRALL